jgi:hypothetical protein
MADILGFLFIFSYWFIIPYFLGILFFKQLKKRWKVFSLNKGAWKIINYIFFLLCALVAWFIEMLILTGLKLCW